jgi:hypothetical protein
MPFVGFDGVTTNATPLHVTVVIVIISAVGGTVTVNVKFVPTQPAAVLGVTIYVAVCVVFCVLRSVPNTLFTTLVPLAPPVIVALNVGTGQLYKVFIGTIPSTSLVGVTVNGTPLHVTVVIAPTSGVGFKVTVTVKFVPTQPAAVLGVTIYVTVCVSFVRLLNVPNTVVGLFVADAPPVTVPVNTGSFHVYLVNSGTIPLAGFVGVTVNGIPLHVTVVIALTSGVGFNVTITVNAAPTQLPDNGVTL